MIPQWALFLTNDKPISPFFGEHDCDEVRRLWFKLHKPEPHELKWKSDFDTCSNEMKQIAEQRAKTYNEKPEWPHGTGKRWKTLTRDHQCERLLVFASQKASLHNSKTLDLYHVLEQNRKDLDVVVQDGWINKIKNIGFKEGKWELILEEELITKPRELLIQPKFKLHVDNPVTTSRLAGLVVLVLLHRRNGNMSMLKRNISQAVPEATSIEIDQSIALVMSFISN
jgi:hypothetical protein